MSVDDGGGDDGGGDDGGGVALTSLLQLSMQHHCISWFVASLVIGTSFTSDVSQHTTSALHLCHATHMKALYQLVCCFTCSRHLYIPHMSANRTSASHICHVSYMHLLCQLIMEEVMMEEVMMEEVWL